MASLGFFQMFAFFLAASFLISPISTANLTSALFAFGDGLYDLGNDAILNSNSPYNRYPYGIRADCTTGRPSDGHLVVDFIADSNLHQRVRPYHANVTAQWHHGVSFATAGARVNSDKSDYNMSTQVVNFRQVRDYLVKTYGEAETQKLLSNSLYVITFGTSEYLELGPDVDAATLIGTIDEVIGACEEAIRDIYRLGGRKFGFQNLGPLREMPYFKNHFNTTPTNISCDADYKPVAQWHNIMLEEKLHQLATCERDGELWLQGFQYAYFDYHSVVTNLINSFYEGTDACCGSGQYRGEMTCAIGDESVDYNLCSNPSQYVWFDGIHPSQAANEIIAEQFWSGNSTVVWPYNLKQLLESTAVAGAAKATTFSASM